MKNKKTTGSIKKILLLFITLYSSALFSQQVIFNKLINFQVRDGGLCLSQTNDSGFVFTGSSALTMTSAYYPSRVKTDQNGTVQWQYTYPTNPSAYYDLGNWIEQTPDGGYIMTVDSQGVSIWDNKIVLLKTKASGQVQWTKHYGSLNIPHYGRCIRPTFDGGYIVCGQELSTGYHQWMRKVDANGVTQWYYIYYEDDLQQVFQTPDSGYIAVGHTRTIGPGSMNAMLLKTDKNGIQQWVQTYGTSGYSYAYGLDTIPGGGYIILCNLDTCGLALLKTDAGGNVLWVNAQNEVNNLLWTDQSIHHCSDGGYFYAGTTNSPLIISCDTSHTTNVVAVKTNSTGDTLWTRGFGYQLDSTVTSAGSLQTYDGGYAILGSMRSNECISSNNPPSDYVLIKLDGSGNIIGINSMVHSTQKTVIAYPSPSTDGKFIIEMKNIKEGEIEIYDVMGEKVYQSAITNLKSKIDLSNQAAGIYFVRLQTDDGEKILTEKIVKQ